MARQRMIVPIFIPHQGCPYRCVFCNQEEISGSNVQEDRARLETALQTYLQSHPREKLPPYREAAFYGGTFTALPFRRQQFFLDAVQSWVDQGLIHGMRLSTHPSAINARVLTFLSRYSIKTIELGVQSTDPQVLKYSGREETLESLESSARWIKRRGYGLGLQLMLGLPGDCERTFGRTVDQALAMDPDCVRIYPALVVRNTALYRMYLNGNYTPWSLERTVEALKSAVQKFSSKKIPVIRLGLHPEPSLMENLVAGPYHPALRSLVDSRIGYDELYPLFQGQKTFPSRVVLRVPERKVSNYTGYAKENSLKLKEKFSIKELIFQGSPGLSAPEFRL